MERLLVLGPGGSGKSVFAREVAAAAGLPLVELDQLFWSASLEPTPAARWAEVQAEVAAAPRWVIDGDLGPYDVLGPRLARADTVVVLDLPRRVCVWRALRRSRGRWDFWRWVLTWRRRYRLALVEALAAHAPQAEVVWVRRARDVEPTKRRLVDAAAA